MIDIKDVKPGLTCFYQQPHMRSPEYGVIVRVNEWGEYVFVRFMFDTTAKACHPRDLYWPPDFCAIHANGPPGQIYDHS